MVLDSGVIAEFDDPKKLKQDENSLFKAMVEKSGTQKVQE